MGCMILPGDSLGASDISRAAFLLFVWLLRSCIFHGDPSDVARATRGAAPKGPPFSRPAVAPPDGLWARAGRNLGSLGRAAYFGDAPLSFTEELRRQYLVSRYRIRRPTIPNDRNEAHEIRDSKGISYTRAASRR